MSSSTGLISRAHLLVAEEGDLILKALCQRDQATLAALGLDERFPTTHAPARPAHLPQDLLAAYVGFYKDAASAFFSTPKDRLDPTLWSDDENLRPDVTEAIISGWNGLYGPIFNGLYDWSKLILIGSGTSYQYGDSEDADVNWVVDVAAFRIANPDLADVEWHDIRSAFHHLAVGHIDGNVLPGGQPWQIFVRSEESYQDFYEKARYMAQGAWDILGSQWLIDPIKIDWGFDATKAFGEWQPEADQTVLKAKDLLNIYQQNPDSEQALDNLKQFYQKLHDDRQSGFSEPGMGGQWSQGNFFWQTIEQAGLMEPIKEAVGGYLLSKHASTQDAIDRAKSQVPNDGADGAGEIEVDGYMVHWELWTPGCLDTMGGSDYEDEMDRRIAAGITYYGHTDLEYLDHEILPYDGSMGEDAISFTVYRKPLSATSSYDDVRAKGSAIYRAGGVEPIKLTPEFSEANVTSSSGQTYYNILRFGDGPKISDWVCECPWSKWNYDRSSDYKYLEHRKCAHSLAHLYYLMSFQNMALPYLQKLEDSDE